jgi:hypothetical protein
MGWVRPVASEKFWTSTLSEVGPRNSAANTSHWPVGEKYGPRASRLLGTCWVRPSSRCCRYSCALPISPSGVSSDAEKASFLPSGQRASAGESQPVNPVPAGVFFVGGFKALGHLQRNPQSFVSRKYHPLKPLGEVLASTNSRQNASVSSDSSRP